MLLQQTINPSLTPRANEQVPFVSVVVPVRNEARFIRSTLLELLHQDYPIERFEVIVADGNSTDGTPTIVGELANHFPNLALLANPKRWSSAGRNQGIRKARGEIVVIVDGHCKLNTTRYLQNLVDAFASSGADCVGRPQPLDVTGANALQRAIAAARSTWLGHHPASYIFSCNEQFVPAHSVGIAYRRRVFQQVGFFDECFDACEDVEFNHRLDRARLLCFLTPKARVHYHPRSTLGGLLGQMTRYGRGRVRLLRKHPGTFGILGFLPALFVLGLVLGPIMAWLFPGLGVAYLGTLALYLATVFLATAAITFRSGDVLPAVWLPVVYTSIHIGAGWGMLRELLLPGSLPAPRSLQPVERGAHG